MTEKITLHFLVKKNVEGSRWSSVTAMFEVDRAEFSKIGEVPPKLYIGKELITGIALPEIIKPGGEIVAILQSGEKHSLGFIDKIEVLPE